MITGTRICRSAEKPQADFVLDRGGSVHDDICWGTGYHVASVVGGYEAIKNFEKLF